MPSPLLDTFISRLAPAYEELDSLKSPPRIASPVAPATPDLEARRAYALADTAAREWVSWALSNPPDSAYRAALDALGEVPPIHDHDSARDADGWLQAAFQRLAGYPRMVVGAAREAVSCAAEIDLDLPGVDNADDIAGVGRAAGDALARAAWLTNDAAEAERLADATVTRLAQMR